jgi:hypothetical protein
MSMTKQPSGWAVGYTAFAGTVLTLAGVFHIMAGLGGIFNDTAYAVTPKWVFQFDTTSWGWIHLIGGILIVLAGLSVFKGHMYGRIIGTTAAMLSAIANFAWLPYREWWAVLMIVLDLGVIWALTVHGHDIAADEG